MKLPFIFLFCGIALAAAAQDPIIYEINNGSVHFKSEAPLEIIQAQSDQLKGLIDFTNQTFAFSIPVTSFMGFNSALQREHFNENYMETDQFPRATFSGRLIESIDPSRDGEYIVRAKGKLSIHGVEHERIIRSAVEVRNNTIRIHSAFSVLLADFNIGIPKVVQQKIAEEIRVEINGNGNLK
ncbi:MAG TPA: YceI family protein [Chryseosolibacter sp.]|nr:YceI family protein [Chryseosolibacter sp.]